MLRAGGSKRHKELLAPFGLDASDPAFWHRGLGVVESFIAELEAMASGASRAAAAHDLRARHPRTWRAGFATATGKPRRRSGALPPPLHPLLPPGSPHPHTT